MPRSTFATLLGLIIAVGACAEPPKTKLPPDTSAAVNGNTAFAFELYAELAKKDDNLFFSPYSISNALAMTYAGARGETEKQMAKTLHFTLDQKRMHSAFRDLKKQMLDANAERKYELHIANRLWGQKNFGFLPEFVAATEKNYGAGLKEVDFVHDREAARAAINGWGEEQTKSRIKDLIKPGILDKKTRLVLANAIYFKATWQEPFAESETKEGDFTMADGKKIKTNLMRGKIHCRYLKGDDFEVLEMAYVKWDLSMIVLLPGKADALPALENRLTTANLKAWHDKLRMHETQVTIPKFKHTSEFSLGDVLAKMGMPIAFAEEADFRGIAASGRLSIAHVLHKAFVEVKESGTEAAAATVVEHLERSVPPPPATFRADHPFIYLIRDNRTGSILFIGRLTKPS